MVIYSIDGNLKSSTIYVQQNMNGIIHCDLQQKIGEIHWFGRYKDQFKNHHMVDFLVSVGIVPKFMTNHSRQKIKNCWLALDCNYTHIYYIKKNVTIVLWKTIIVRVFWYNLF